MGAANFTNYVPASTPSEAFAEAQAHAEAEHGHEQGYSGAINSKDGFALFQLPPRVSAEKMLGWIETWSWADPQRTDEWASPQDRREAERAIKRIPEQHRVIVARMSRVYEEKWGPAVAFEADAATSRRLLARRRENGWTVKRGTKVYVFCGYAPC